MAVRRSRENRMKRERQKRLKDRAKRLRRAYLATSQKHRAALERYNDAVSAGRTPTNTSEVKLLWAKKKSLGAKSDAAMGELPPEVQDNMYSRGL